MDFTLPANIEKQIGKRLKEFEALGKSSPSKWFSELCFCILTANSKARTAIAIQKELGPEGFSSYTRDDISASIRKNRHRFHNMKARYIIEARSHIRIKHEITSIVDRLSERDARDWLAATIKGIGMKEASHFMRNVGYKNIAILDRHILRFMAEHGIIKEVPKSLTKNIYLEFENMFLELADNSGMTAAELDLRIWYKKTGAVLK